ncbi:MAG TPA: hypothetical protein VIA18_05840 [Polyangia bacterium]|nr:hypothetical protein [Polyangia bacterium]
MSRPPEPTPAKIAALGLEKSGLSATAARDEAAAKSAAASLDSAAPKSAAQAHDNSATKSTTSALENAATKSPASALDNATTTALDNATTKSATPTLDNSATKSATPALDNATSKSTTPALDNATSKSATPALDNPAGRASGAAPTLTRARSGVSPVAVSNGAGDVLSTATSFASATPPSASATPATPPSANATTDGGAPAPRTLGPWSRRVVRALAEVVQPIGANAPSLPLDDYVRFIDDYVPHMPRLLKLLFPVGLMLLELGAFLLGPSLVPFSSMSLARRARYVDSWVHARWGLRRDLIKAVKGLCLLAYYSDPRVGALLGYTVEEHVALVSAERLRRHAGDI